MIRAPTRPRGTMELNARLASRGQTFAAVTQEGEANRSSKFEWGSTLVSCTLKRAHKKKWWARQDSNLQPRDSLWSRCFQREWTISSPAPFRILEEGGGVRDALACYQGHSDSPPGPKSRASNPPSGSLCTFRRCTAGLAQGCHAVPARVRRKGSLNSSRPLRGFRTRRHLLSMSPLH